MCLGVHCYFEDYSGAEAEVSKGWVGKEEVHGGVEVGIRANDQDDDEQVLEHSDQEQP